MARKSIGIRAEEYCFWVSHPAKVLSFHPERGFVKCACEERAVMWERIHSLMEQDYLVL